MNNMIWILTILFGSTRFFFTEILCETQYNIQNELHARKTIEQTATAFGDLVLTFKWNCEYCCFLSMYYVKHWLLHSENPSLRLWNQWYTEKIYSSSLLPAESADMPLILLLNLMSSDIVAPLTLLLSRAWRKLVEAAPTSITAGFCFMVFDEFTAKGTTNIAVVQILGTCRIAASVLLLSRLNAHPVTSFFTFALTSAPGEERALIRMLDTFPPRTSWTSQHSHQSWVIAAFEWTSQVLRYKQR